jgi:subtilisin family serine protease
MKKIVYLFVFLISLQLFAQEDAWVYLKDKPAAAEFLNAPLTMLSQRALDRRVKQNIAVDNKDVPMEVNYYSQIKNATGITVLAASKWLNSIHVQGTQTNINNLKTNYSFVDNIEFANKGLNAKGVVTRKLPTIKKGNKFEKTKTDFNYGDATNQISMLKGDYLNEQGHTGSGMQIAVIDAGFPNVNTLAAFERLRDNNQILGGYDFVDRSENFYTGNNHGTNVLSDIGGYIDGQFVGTAPDASFYLFRTEDGANEVPLEESLWVEAAERADSLGVDIINTSLGYTTFDNPNYNYTYADMDGNTTFISRGAEIGASRGMLLVNAIGNSGNSAWKYLGAPADAASVFAVGAVNAIETIASFSSFGPTADSRIKPDVLAHGQSVYVISHITGNPITSNGTSFSSPIMAGVLACFWQAFPNLTNTQVMQRIRESADRYSNPHEQYGYGLPNFETAYATVLKIEEQALIKEISIYPNPVTTTFTLKVSNYDVSGLSIQIFSIIGKKVFEKWNLKNTIIDVSELNSGIYILKILSDTQEKTMKFIKR